MTDQEIEVDDPDELSQKTRVRELLTRRKEVIDARDAAKEAHLFGEISKQNALLYYRGKIESLIIDLYTKFKAADGGSVDGNYYLREVKIDTITIPVPSNIPTTREHGLAANAEPPTASTIPIQGLKWFLEQPDYIQETFRARTMTDGPGWQEEIATTMVPESALDEALLICTEFMDELGIDVELTAGTYEGGDEPGL